MSTPVNPSNAGKFFFFFFLPRHEGISSTAKRCACVLCQLGSKRITLADGAIGAEAFPGICRLRARQVHGPIFSERGFLTLPEDGRIVHAGWVGFPEFKMCRLRSGTREKKPNGEVV